ncbi:MAG: hypothetical protein Q9219_004305 [cf. Caloplaca sp. 3 TL-2023]
MSPSHNTIVAFDLYGTLLSTESIAKELAKHFGEEKAATVASTWRKYQLEYTWRLNSMSMLIQALNLEFEHARSGSTDSLYNKDQYLPFSTVTQRSLHHALSENNLRLPSSSASTTISSILSAYDSLSTFPDVAPELSLISTQQPSSITPVIFSNGTQDMVASSILHSPDLSPYSKVFKAIITVEEVRKFKPHPDVYFHLAERMGKGREQMGEMWLVSGNPFDIVGAKAVGMRTCWVDRGGEGWVDGLVEGGEGRPDMVMRGLGEVVGDESEETYWAKPWKTLSG